MPVGYIMSVVANKLVLGTAQLGLNYGVNNTSGKINEEEGISILQFCREAGLKYIDTSNAYGNAQARLGDITQKYDLDFDIISKVHAHNAAEVGFISERTYVDLKVKKLYGYLCHDFTFFRRNPSVWRHFQELQLLGKVEKIGFSLYYPHEFNWLLESHIPFNIIQVPYSIFDQRFEECFRKCRDLDIEVHVRSVFLQGLFFMSPDLLPGKLQSVRHQLQSLQAYSKAVGIPVQHLALATTLQNQYIDKAVIGVDNLDNLKSNISIDQYVDAEIDYDFLLSHKLADEKILIPSNW